MIRKMCQQDLEQVLSIEKENFSTPWHRQGFLDALDIQQNCYLVYEEDNIIQGYCGAYVVCGEADITNVSVGKKYQNKHIAKQMLTELFSLLSKDGVNSYTLEVRASNAVAIHLYETLGFVSEGYRPKFYDLPVEDAMIMWKRG